VNSWLILESGAGAAAFNMALDETLLEAMPRLQRPVLRFYEWTERAASFGYFQRYPEIEPLTTLRPLVRRPTGGGLVRHDADWTYSLIFPAGHEWHGLKAAESYRRVHDWLRVAFAGLNVATELALHCRKDKPGQCFAGYEKFDLLSSGKKIAGAAQRRTRDGLLIQGSIQPPAAVSRADWHREMHAVASSQSGVAWQEFKPEPGLCDRAADMAVQKYSSELYNRKR
jgi:lipoate-protein ligase A